MDRDEAEKLLNEYDKVRVGCAYSLIHGYQDHALPEKLKESRDKLLSSLSKPPSNIIYVAGKYDDSNVMGVFRNINLGITTCTELFLKGYSPFCPWLDFHFLLSMSQQELSTITKQSFLDYSLDFLRISKALLVLPNYETSPGTLLEISTAQSLSIPIFYSKSSLYSTIK